MMTTKQATRQDLYWEAVRDCARYGRRGDMANMESAYRTALDLMYYDVSGREMDRYLQRDLETVRRELDSQ